MISRLDATTDKTDFQSSQYENGRFSNEKPVNQKSVKERIEIFWRFFTEKKINAEPDVVLPVNAVTREGLHALSNETTHIIKLGHSSILIKTQGRYILLDPVFAERASPFSFAGPKRFHDVPILISDLPDIDYVLISHNHYDHLDKQAVMDLNEKTLHFLVPLGVDGDLQKWGIDADKIDTFDWWQSYADDELDLFFTFAPTQHFSGRGLGDANATLWGSWAINTQQEKLYFSGDSGYFKGFKEIGERLGPFDITMIETGAYDKDWADIHMTPEQSIQAHTDLGGGYMIPIHNGTFDLAFHAWYEPLERVSEAAIQSNVNLLTPEVGAVMSLGKPMRSTYWWKPLMP
ncbi:MAG: MBL fold metallo-hydrolase [Alteromonadaceae bacterium]|nr:MBL fold metallo-hydrolase [Alteromonadaceae bacterium]